MSKNAERLRKYRHKMNEAGFRRLSFYVSPELAKLLDTERQPSECGGRVLERLILGQAAKRPDYWTSQEKAARQAKATAFRQRLAQISR